MRLRRSRGALAASLLLLATGPAEAPAQAADTTPRVPARSQPAPARTPPGTGRLFEAKDVFELEWASNPQISPDGQRVAYQRNSMDVMTDRRRSRLWLVSADGRDHRPLGTGGERDEFMPRWSPDGTRLLYAAREGDTVQLFVRFMDTGQTACLTHVQKAPNDAAWSPDGRSIAFTMLVPQKTDPFAAMPDKPEGAKWADPPRVIQRLVYRADGEGYLEAGFVHLFVLPADGGTPRQLTTGEFHVGGRPAFSPDGRAILIAGNRHPDWEYEPNDSEIYEVTVADGAIRALTDRRGPDLAPAISPDGRTIAYLGYDDRYQGYQVTHLYLMNRDGTGARLLTDKFDRDVGSPIWSGDGKGLFFDTADHGNGKIAWTAAAGPSAGKIEIVASDLGGGDLGRPYGGGTFSVSASGRIAYTLSRVEIPSDVAVAARGTPQNLLTRLNDDLFGGKTLATAETISFESSFDHRPIQGWVLKPPAFDAAKKYPLILEIHGGPFADYGDRFGAELQLYAAAGYVVLYTNPRGSTGYGEEFGNLIHHDYPSHDYEDLMSGVDTVLARGYVDPAQLYVTGGSGGGVLTAWIVGQTDRFRAAVSAKPVINWMSFVLTSDETSFFTRYWFASPPWENPEEYIRRSPLRNVGRVKTPTMLLVGEQDFRTPISEAEQFYTALKLRKVDTALVRFPGASHDLITRPSQLIAKVSYILSWFEKHRPAAAPGQGAATGASAEAGQSAPAGPDPGMAGSISLEKAARYFSEFDRLCARDGGKLWGVSLCGPILFVDPETRKVVANRADPQNTIAARGGLFVGDLPAGVPVANTAVEWLGTRWTMILWGSLDEDRRERLRLMAHEAFHRVQPQLGLEKAGEMNDHLDTRDGRFWMQMEWNALQKALLAEDDTRRAAVADALAFRATRRALFPKASEREDWLEVFEGLAEYSGLRLAGFDDADVLKAVAEKRTGMTGFVRSFAYVSGPLYGFLLDDARRGWRKHLTPTSDLGGLLADAMGIAPAAGELEKRTTAYGGPALLAAETERETRSQARLAAWRASLIDGPVLIVDLKQVKSGSFDPGKVYPMGEKQTVYTTRELGAEWGLLTVREGAILEDGNTMQGRVSLSGAAEGQLKGPGWALALAGGWSIAPAARAGDFQVVRK